MLIGRLDLLLLNDRLAGFLHHSGEGFQDGVTISLETIGYLNELIRAAGQFVTGVWVRRALGRLTTSGSFSAEVFASVGASRDIPIWQIRTVCESN